MIVSLPLPTMYMVLMVNGITQLPAADTTICFRIRMATGGQPCFLTLVAQWAAEYKVTCRPGLIPMLYENGKFKPNHNYQAK